MIAAAKAAAVSAAFYVVSTAVNGTAWNSEALWKSVGQGALNGAITFGIGSAFGATGGAGGLLKINNGLLKEGLRTLTHATVQGAMTATDGGNFWAGAASGAFGSITSNGL